MVPAVLNRVVGVVAGAGFTAAADRLLTRTELAERSAWTRTNYRGRTVSLAGGAAAAAGSVLGACVSCPPRWRAAVLLAGGSAAAAGAYDDLVAPRTELSADKGWRGHLRALRSGRVSGGVVKIAVIGTGALVAARSVSRTWAGALPAAALIATSANLVNLFDLRPGRAGKVTLAASATLLGGPAAPIAAAIGGAALAGLPADLGERRILGDLGANTLGALLGLRLAAAGPVTRAAASAGAVALTVASERVSFSEVIECSPALRRIDGWGRLGEVGRLGEAGRLDLAGRIAGQPGRPAGER